MIYDCFLFNNELDILDIRIHELERVIDKFVLVESTVTHVGKPKPLFFSKNKERYKRYLHKIIHVVVRDSPEVSLPWIINDYQFSQMARGLNYCKPNDIILFGDLDEIPKAQKVKEWANKSGKLKVFQQILSFYYLNYAEYKQRPWLGTRMTTYKQLLKYKTTWIAKYAKYDCVIPDAGWHFSYIGDTKNFQQKLSQMTHQELNSEKYNTYEKITQAIVKREDPFGFGYRFRIMDINTMPRYVVENRKKFEKFLATKYTENLSMPKIKLFFLPVRHFLRISILRKLKKMIQT